jgi:hypothetical protein
MLPPRQTAVLALQLQAAEAGHQQAQRWLRLHPPQQQLCCAALLLGGWQSPLADVLHEVAVLASACSLPVRRAAGRQPRNAWQSSANSEAARLEQYVMRHVQSCVYIAGTYLLL